MAKSNKQPLMSDIGLEMDDLIKRVKTMKGHKDTKDKLQEMQSIIDSLKQDGIIKQAYFQGVKTAEDMASGNEDYDSSDEEKSKADTVINKLRVGWTTELHGDKKDRKIDKIQNSAEADNESSVQINSSSPELQDFSTTAVNNYYDQ